MTTKQELAQMEQEHAEGWGLDLGAAAEPKSEPVEVADSGIVKKIKDALSGKKPAPAPVPAPTEGAEKMLGEGAAKGAADQLKDNLKRREAEAGA